MVMVTGSVVALTLNMNEAVTVAGGTPTLTLNDGGTATYTGGTGTNALTFSYTVAAGQNTADLAVTGVNMNAATVKDGAGMNANLSGAMTNPAGALQVNTTTATGAPTLTSIVQTPSGGDLNAGDTVTLTLNLNQAVTVAGGTPTLTLNDGGIATYTGSTGGQTYADGSAGRALWCAAGPEFIERLCRPRALEGGGRRLCRRTQFRNYTQGSDHDQYGGCFLKYERPHRHDKRQQHSARRL